MIEVLVVEPALTGNGLSQPVAMAWVERRSGRRTFLNEYIMRLVDRAGERASRTAMVLFIVDRQPH